MMESVATSDTTSTKLSEASRPTEASEGATVDLRDDVIRHRSALKLAMTELEAALAAPSRADGDRWLREASAAVSNLGVALERHIGFHEGPDAFHAEIVAKQPHLVPRVTRLQREHLRARQLLAELMAAVSAAEEGDVLAPDAAEVRMLGSELLLLLVHHRQRGADLVWDSINLDLGSGD